MSQQSLFITDGGASGNNASVTATNTPDGGFSLQGLIAQYNSSAPTLTSGNLSFLQTDVNGNLKVTTVNSAAETDAASPGSAVPAQTSWIGASDGTDLQGLRVESATQPNLRTSLYYGATEMKIGLDGYTAVHQADSPWVVSGTVTANQGGTWTVQQGTPPWTVIGTTTTNSAAGNAVQVLPAEFISTGGASALTGPVDGYSFALSGGGVTSGNATFAQTDGYGRLEVSPARAVAFAYENRTNQTVVLKNTAGTFRKVIVGNSGATASLITFYDNTTASGTIIAKINPSNILGQLSFDIAFKNGLTYTTNSKSPGDVTITFE